MNKLKTIWFYPNGHVSAFDDQEERMDEVQDKGWMELYFEYLVSKGFNPEEVTFETKNNAGQWCKVKAVKTPNGWSVDFEELT